MEHRPATRWSEVSHRAPDCGSSPRPWAWPSRKAGAPSDRTCNNPATQHRRCRRWPTDTLRLCRTWSSPMCQRPLARHRSIRRRTGPIRHPRCRRACRPETLPVEMLSAKTGICPAALARLLRRQGLLRRSRLGWFPKYLLKTRLPCRGKLPQRVSAQMCWVHWPDMGRWLSPGFRCSGR